jgi:hypothetical protein
MVVLLIGARFLLKSRVFVLKNAQNLGTWGWLYKTLNHFLITILLLNSD